MTLSSPIKGIGKNGIYISQKFGNVLILSKPYTFSGVTYPAGTNFYKAAFGMNGHNGIDIACPIGTPVYAEHDGVVTAHGNAKDGGYGYYVRLNFAEDGFEWRVTEGHLSEILKTGQVKRGELIAKSGNTGTSTNPHCHRSLEQFKNDILLNKSNGYKGAIDPEPFTKENMTNAYVIKNGMEYAVAQPATSEDGLITLLRSHGLPTPLTPDGKLDFVEIDKIASVL